MSGELLFNRSVWVIVDGVQVRDLRVMFRVSKTGGKEPNTCEVTINNLKRETRAQMRTKDAQVSVFAGYGNKVTQLFSGTARRINHVHQRPDWVTKIECGDGESAFLNARVSESFKAGTKWKDVARKVARSLVTDTGNLEEKLAPLTDTFVNGFTAHGRSAAVLDKLLKGRQLQWSIQDGRLQLLGPGDANADAVTVLSSDTGLIGSPEFGTAPKKDQPDVLKLRTLLQPQIRPGSRIRVKAREIEGDFVALEVQHEGDTAGAAWYTDIEAQSL